MLENRFCCCGLKGPHYLQTIKIIDKKEANYRQKSSKGWFCHSCWLGPPWGIFPSLSTVMKKHSFGKINIRMEEKRCRRWLMIGKRERMQSDVSSLEFWIPFLNCNELLHLKKIISSVCLTHAPSLLSPIPIGQLNAGGKPRWEGMEIIWGEGLCP